ncbi:MAG: hypothetical protein AAF721_26335, partial [Myxococcota bacterium]
MDALLKLVPKDSTGFLVIRDPEALFSLVHPFVKTTLGTLPGFVTEADVLAKIEAVAVKYDKLRGALAHPDLALDKGVVMSTRGGALVLVHGGTNPSALSSATEGIFDLPVATECAAVEGVPGYVACAKDVSTLSAYAPGNDAEAVRTPLADALPGVDLASTNVVGHAPGAVWPFAVQTPPGRLQVSFGLPELPPETAKFLAPGPATGLGLLGAGSAFIWGRVAVEPLAAALPP